MTLNEFRNRLKQVKAYKAEMERRLRRTPMRSGDDDGWKRDSNWKIWANYFKSMNPLKLEDYCNKMREHGRDDLSFYISHIYDEANYNPYDQINDRIKQNW